MLDHMGFGSHGKPFFWIEWRGEPVCGRLHALDPDGHNVEAVCRRPA
jgi:hypothetical protein